MTSAATSSAQVHAYVRDTDEPTAGAVEKQQCVDAAVRCHSLSDAVRSLQPPPADNAAVLEALEDIKNKMDDIKNKMDDQRQQMDDLKRLEERRDLRESQMMARLQNAIITNKTVRLEPLPYEHVVDGARVVSPSPPDFPETLDDLRGLQAPSVHDLLAAYELPSDGNAVERMRRLASFLGVVHMV